MLNYADHLRSIIATGRPVTEDELSVLRNGERSALIDAVDELWNEKELRLSAARIVAKVLRFDGAPWARQILAREELQMAHAQNHIEIATQCFRPHEAMEWMWNAFPPTNDASILLLQWVGNAEVLDRMENEQELHPSPSWPIVAHRSGLDWLRARAWLRGKRPLSTIAIEALALPDQASGSFPKIAITRKKELEKALITFAENDVAPRSSRAIETVRRLYAL